MQIIIISSDNTRQKHWHFSRASLWMLSALLLLSTLLAANYLSKAAEPIAIQHQAAQQLNDAQADYQQNIAEMQIFYAKQLGGLQAEAIRLKVLSKKLADIAGIDTSDLMFDSIPAQGGIEEQETPLSDAEFRAGISQLSDEFSGQTQTLSALQQYLINRSNITDAIPSGRPIKKGWMSSNYGYRIDPFTGKKAFHSGIDFAGKEGSPVVAVADGIVTWVGKRDGYGGLVEVDHGNGYVTRYAHNEEIEVHQGERVRKGQVLSLMGSTGRSTGPHVHFEVLRDGRKVNPYSFVKAN